MKKVAWLICVLIIGCSGEADNFISESNAEVGVEVFDQAAIVDSVLEERLFADLYYVFSSTIESKNYEIFNGFIDRNNGCYIIESDGAMPYLTSVYDVGEFISMVGGKRFFDIPFPQIDHVVEFEDLPKVVCGENVFDKEGCFARKSTQFKESKIWNYTQLDKETVGHISFLSETIKMTVVNTHNYTFHFSKIDEKWCVTFIDLRVSCSA